jgi:hypothetical protein
MRGVGTAARRLAGAAAIALVLRAAAAAPGPTGPDGPVLGVVGGKPAELVRLDPLTLEPLPGRRVALPYGISGWAWSPDRRLLALGGFDDDVVHVVDPARMRLVRKVRFGIVARAPQQVAWLGPRRLAVVAGTRGTGPIC